MDEALATRQQVHPGAADFLKRLARAEARDAITEARVARDASGLKGPSVRQLSVRAIEDLAAAAPSTPEELTVTATSPAVACDVDCPSPLTAAADRHHSPSRWRWPSRPSSLLTLLEQPCSAQSGERLGAFSPR